MKYVVTLSVPKYPASSEHISYVVDPTDCNHKDRAIMSQAEKATDVALRRLIDERAFSFEDRIKVIRSEELTQYKALKKSEGVKVIELANGKLMEDYLA